MKLRLHWSEKYEMVREYPSFELDSQEFPEIELELLQVYNAGSAGEREQAMGDLEHKMRMTPAHQRGETIFQMVGPSDSLEDSHAYQASHDSGGFYVTEEK